VRAERREFIVSETICVNEFYVGAALYFVLNVEIGEQMAIGRNYWRVFHRWSSGPLVQPACEVFFIARLLGGNARS